MTLLKLIDHDVKQCRLNSCAALYAISCAGRPICREIAEKQPMHKLVALVCPGVGRTSQDDQLQLFAALLVVNLLHVRGAVKTKPERETLSETLQRAYDDSTDQQVRSTILLGVKKLKKAETRKAKLKAGVRGAGSTLVRKMTGGVVGGPKSKPGAPGSAYGGSAESFGSGGTQGGYDGGGYGGGGGGGGFGDRMRNSGGGGSGRFEVSGFGSGGSSSEKSGGGGSGRKMSAKLPSMSKMSVPKPKLPSMGSKRGSKKFSESTDWE